MNVGKSFVYKRFSLPSNLVKYQSMEKTYRQRERARKAREKLGLSQAQLAEKAGVGQSTIGNLEIKDDSYNSRFIKQIANALGVTEEYIRYGVQNEFRHGGHIQAYDDVSELPQNDDIVFVKFARNLTAACGDGVINDEFIDDRPFPFSLNSLKKSGVCDPEKVIVGYADGDSNAPMIPHKSAIGIDTACTTIHHGKFYLITVEGKERIKQIIKLEEGRILLRSQNPDKTVYPDEIFDIDKMIEKQVVIRGRLFWVSWMDRI